MAKKPRSIWSPDHLSDALLREQNKLIHLDPVPIFQERSEIKPWLQKIFFPQGIDLVIERSDSGKVIFKCKTSNKHSSKKKDKEDNNDADSIRTHKKMACPFRIRATFSLKLQKWNIVVVNNVHSHDLEFNPNSEEYKKFKKFLVSKNDITTIKNFEELEYKTKLELPILPEVMTCDCGLTNEINWFNIVLPQSKPLACTNTKRINKKKKKLILNSSSANIANSNSSTTTNNNRNLTTNIVSSSNLLSDTLFDTIPTSTYANTDTSLNFSNNTMENTINLDEIDFTEMFKTLTPSKDSQDNSFRSPKKINKEIVNDSDTIVDELLYNSLQSALPIDDDIVTNTTVVNDYDIDLSYLKLKGLENDFNSANYDPELLFNETITPLTESGLALSPDKLMQQLCKDNNTTSPAIKQEYQEITNFPGNITPTTTDMSAYSGDSNNESYLDFLNTTNCPI